MQANFGYLPVYEGSVKFSGTEWKLGDTNYSVKNGFIYLPEERKKQGILPELSIRDNICLLYTSSPVLRKTGCYDVCRGSSMITFTACKKYSI